VLWSTCLKKWSSHNAKTAKSASKNLRITSKICTIIYPTAMDNSDNEISDARSEIDKLVPAVLLLATIYSRRRPRLLSNRLCTSQEYVDNLLNCDNDIRIHNQLHTKLETFNMLRGWLLQNTKLQSSWHVSIEEKLLIFIYVYPKFGNVKPRGSRTILIVVHKQFRVACTCRS
jgi:hypothetical protein